MATVLGGRLRLVVGVFGELLGTEVRRAARERRRSGDAEGADRRRALAVREALERLGPFYVKVGQILATRPDLVPASMAAELQNLHDQVGAAPFPVLEAVLAEELGPDWKRRFEDVDTTTPLGSASIAQVHRATLTDGRPVVLKIQRPGIRASVQADMRLMRIAARLVARRAPRFTAVMDLEAMLGSLFDAMGPELDFTGEAANMDRARKAIRKYRTLAVPRVVHATPRVLVQSLAPGTSIRDADHQALKDDQREAICEDLLAFMYQGYFVDRFFHADPHPGNVFVAPDGRATLIDWGMVGRMDKRTSMHLALVLMAMMQNDGHSLARAWTAMGHATPWADLPGFSGDMAALAPRMVGSTLSEVNFGAALTAVLEKASRRGIASSPATSLLGKSFSNLEGSIRHLYPDVVVSEVFTREINGILSHLAQDFATPQRLAVTGMELLLSGTSALEQARSVTADTANRDLSLRIDCPPPTHTPHRCRAPLLAAAAAAYLLGRRRSGR